MESLKNKIRILFITSNLGIGGLERVVIQLCMHLDKEIFVPAVCCLHFKGDLAYQLEKSSIPVFTIGIKKPGYLAFMKIIPIIQEFKPQIVHTHNINASIDGIIASVLKRVPVIIHTDHARKFPDKRRYMFAERVVSHFVDRIIAVTEETKINLVRYEKIDEKKIEVVNNGVDRDVMKIKSERNSKKDELGLSHFSNIIGTAVRLEKQKGLIHLIRAISKVLNQFPNVVLVIAGKGSQRESLMEEVRVLGIEGNVRFIGPRLDIAEILQVLDIYVLPSEWEGLPMALLEAMACGRPIVATNVGGIPKAITDGENGILVPPGSSELLGKAICMLLKNRPLREKMAYAAKCRIDSSFTIEKMVNNHQRIYLKHLNKSGFVNANTSA